jgi:pilus assembly protein CpaB
MKKIKIIAFLSAVIAAYLLYNYLDKISEPVVIKVEKMNVVVAAADIFPNTEIIEDMLLVKELPVEAVHEQAISVKADALGNVSASQIIAGEQILSSKLITPGESANDGTLAYVIEPGMRAITVGVNYTKGLSNMIMPENMVDIISDYSIDVEYENGDTETVDYTVLLLQKVKVLAVDGNMTAASKAASEENYSSLTLQVTPRQAMEVSMTEYKGQLRAVLRSPLDEDTVSLPSLTIDKIIVR